MALQDDVDEQVAAIQADLTAAQNTALPESAQVNFGLIKDALTAAADAIDALGGSSVTLRQKIAAITNQDVDLSAIKTANTRHLSAQANIVDLLIIGSNFSGVDQ